LSIAPRQTGAVSARLDSIRRIQGRQTEKKAIHKNYIQK